MRPFSWRFFRYWQRNRDVFFRLWRSEAPGVVIEPVIVLLAFGYGLGAFIGGVEGQSYIQFLAPGIIASYAMFSAIFEATYAAFVRMVFQNTYDAILATPLNAEDIIAGEIFWGATRALMTGTVILAIAAAFQLEMSPWALLIIPLSLLQGIMFSSIAMLYTSLVPAIYSFNYFFTLIVNPMFFLGGVFFPLNSFPSWLQNAAWFAPLTPVVYLTRNLFQGILEPRMWLALGIVLAYGLVFFAISLVTMRRRLTV